MSSIVNQTPSHTNADSFSPDYKRGNDSLAWQNMSGYNSVNVHMYYLSLAHRKSEWISSIVLLYLWAVLCSVFSFRWNSFYFCLAVKRSEFYYVACVWTVRHNKNTDASAATVATNTVNWEGTNTSHVMLADAVPSSAKTLPSLSLSSVK